MPIDDDIRRRFEAVVAGARLPIDPRCRVMLDALVDAGVVRAQTDGLDEAALSRAADHLRVLLDDMTQQSRILRFDALHEPTLASALERLGPPWAVE